MSPILKLAYRKRLYIVDHDPYKSDIYSLGLILLEIALLMDDVSKREIA